MYSSDTSKLDRFDGKSIVLHYPEDLPRYDQWVCWRYGEYERGDKPKIPLSPTTGQPASLTDSDTWGSFANAVSAVESDRVQCDGIGFVFTEADPFAAVKRYNCVTLDGHIPEEPALQIILMESYTEIDPSDCGVLTIVRGSKPEGPSRNGDIEICYRERFFPITGKCYKLNGTAPNKYALKSLYNRRVKTADEDSAK